MLQQLTAQDAQFLYIETANNLAHVMGVNVYDPSTAPGGKVRFKDILAHIQGRLHCSAIFKRRLHRLPLDLDHPYWVEDEHFDLEAHISHARLPAPGDWRQFCIQIARHHSKPMDLNRPPWDMFVIEGLDNIKGIKKGSYAIATRIHHAAIDGASGVHFFSAMSDIDAKGTPAMKLPKKGPEIGRKPTMQEAMQRAWISNITSPVKMINSAMKLSPAIWDAVQNLSGDKAEKSSTSVPETRFNVPVSPHKMFDAVIFDLDDFKAIRKKAEDATINDAILAVCSGALRLYLKKHKELPKESLVAIAPVNKRTSSAEAKNPGNNISAMTVRLWTGIADPIERLAAIQDTTRQTKAAQSGISARIMTDMTQHIPGVTMAGVARIMSSERFMPKLSNVFISNVPGPQMPLYMNGAKITHQYSMAPLTNNMGLFIATPSYDGKLSFSITSDRKIMPDIEFFRECLQKSFEELRDSKPKKPKKAKKGGAKRKSGSTQSRSGRKKKASGRKKAA